MKDSQRYAEAYGGVAIVLQELTPLTCTPPDTPRHEGEALTEPIDRQDIPTVPEQSIAYIDGYGNLKTTIICGQRKDVTSSSIHVHIGNVEHHSSIGAGIIISNTTRQVTTNSKPRRDV